MIGVSQPGGTIGGNWNGQNDAEAGANECRAEKGTSFRIRVLKGHRTNRIRNDYPDHRITTPGTGALQCPNFKKANRQDM